MRYRLSMAKERLDSSKLLLEHASYKDSIGRSYYAMFIAVRAILALDGLDFKKHAGVIFEVQREYVKTKIFDVKYSKYLSQAFQIRNNTDYADFFVVSEGEAEEQYERAQDFYKAIAHYLTERKYEIMKRGSRSLFLRGGKGVKTGFMIHVFLAHVHSLVKHI